ncbi:SDR family NAD(P)-dependent oxidoreductase [Paenibacillus xerothermodurans]|uniref:SDR family NAD(P)-dependent oxidoreductase n=1 Tax=Paenibacillus xerothermodurans TaxID=1977292 RepID=A0A2W1P194_PAEXE|nr:SDR family oxidoreductase [Paenibacillus xerothermodurans]PZE21512.1 SDR family NAD(P)-dependent oxidoreductase [Paenibacillus xerothermodurans]
MDLGLNGKRVLVTGSTMGIGKAIAKSFAAEGADVIVNGRDEATVQRTVEELSAHGPSQIMGIAADLTSDQDVKKLVRRIDDMGGLDVLVNNVGIFEAKPFEQVTDEEWLRYFNVNVMSAVRLSRIYLPKMLERNKGRVILIASEAGLKPLPLMIHYSVTKTALIGLARGLAELTKGTGVTVNSVLPGPTWTEGVEQFMIGAAQSEGMELESVIADYFKKNEPTSLIQRFAAVEEVADTVVYLASEKASAINGSSQRVEGGIIRAL